MPQNTVFVIGAGASQEAGLPIGKDLKTAISRLLDIQHNGINLESGDKTILDALNLHIGQPSGISNVLVPYLNEAHRISGALPLAESIDNYIDQHRDNKKIELCGKLAIVRSILDAEKGSHLYFRREGVDSNIDFESLSETWYISFFKLLTVNCTENDLKRRLESITLIIFNYDRCVEHFLYFALQKHYGLYETEAAELVKNINIYHPYGSVGTLPWINSNRAVAFGLKPKPQQILDIAKQIKTFAEGTDPNISEILKIRKHMRLANRLVFLGFAFHKLNMQLIAPEHDKTVEPINIKCFSTTLEISDSDKKIIDEQIHGLYSTCGGVSVEVKRINLRCGPFFSEFWRSLAF